MYRFIKSLSGGWAQVMKAEESVDKKNRGLWNSLVGIVCYFCDASGAATTYQLQILADEG